jgi:HAD superfamily hydrolase (TIGR01509 family)
MGTLVHDPFFAEMPGFFALTFDELLEAKHPSAWVDFELGRISEEEFLDQFFADGREFDQRGFVDEVRASYRWLPGIEELLGELAEAETAMHAFSNYPVWYRLIEERLGLSRFLEWTFVSCRTGVRKPDAAAYATVLRELKVPAERCIFVDDRAPNCDAARKSGIHAVQYRGVEPLRDSLTAAGLIP